MTHDRDSPATNIFQRFDGSEINFIQEAILGDRVYMLNYTLDMRLRPIVQSVECNANTKNRHGQSQISLTSQDSLSESSKPKPRTTSIASATADSKGRI